MLAISLFLICFSYTVYVKFASEKYWKVLREIIEDTHETRLRGHQRLNELEIDTKALWEEVNRLKEASAQKQKHVTNKRKKKK